MKPHGADHLSRCIPGKLQILESYKGAVLYITVGTQPVVSGFVAIKCTRNIGLVSIFAPSPVNGSTLVIGSVHVFQIHSCRVHNLASKTVIEGCAEREV